MNRVEKILRPAGLRMTVLFLILIVATAFAEGLHREPAVAGAFYPKDPVELSKMIDGFLEQALVDVSVDMDAVKVVIVPHAGVVYSGKTAAFVYKKLIGRHFDSVVLIGPSHQVDVDGASIWTSGDWQTPLGTVGVDEPLAKAIAAENPKIWFQPQAHLKEHSLEVQLPFLQRTLQNFKIVPIVVNHANLEITSLLAQAVAKQIKDKNVLVVISTDMSHYYTDEVARVMDARAIELLKKEDTLGILDAASKKEIEFCGLAAVLTGIEIAKELGESKLQVLNYSNSSDATGDKSRVVGYGASILRRSSSRYSEEERQRLLRVARQTIESFVTNAPMPEIPETDEKLKEDRAVFVTLKENGTLRGCIGSLTAVEPLGQAVRRMAVQAASQDPRFKPVQKEELSKINIEISVLSQPQKINSPDEIVLGRDGVIVKQDGHSGVFLPQVASETQWTKTQFLNELCSQKAHLEANCWQDPKTELYTFTAEAFKEGESE